MEPPGSESDEAMDGMDEDLVDQPDADELVDLVDLLTERMDQLELAISGDKLPTVIRRKPITVGDQVFASDTEVKLEKKKRQSSDSKLLKVGTLLHYTNS